MWASMCITRGIIHTYMKRYFPALAASILLSPLFVLAATGDIPAGFAPSSIFASKTSITAGDAISLFSVLYNSSAEELTLDVVFTIDGTEIGTKHVSLAAGETQTPSISWTSTEGTHTASAHLDNVVGSDSGISLQNDKADTITLSVAAPPPPSPTTQAVNTVTSALASSTPVVTNIANNVFNLTEAVRQGAIDALQNQLTTATAPKGQVLGAQEVYTGSDTPSEASGNGSFFNTLWQKTLQALLFVFRIQMLFYALLLFVIFILYRLLRTWMSER